MHEDALSFSLGNLQVFYYGLHIALGFLALLLALAFLRRRYHLPDGVTPLFGVMALPLALLCSRLLFCLLDTRFLSVFSFRSLFSFWGGGFSMVGALMGIALSALISAKLLRCPYLRLLDALTVGVLLFIVFARIGEQYTELLGRSRPLVSAFFKDSFLASGDQYASYLKTYALEAVTALVLAFALLLFSRQKRRAGDQLLAAMLLLGCTQVLWESLRFDVHMRISFISLQQLLYAVMFAIPLFIFAARRARSLHSKSPVIISIILIAVISASAVGLEFLIDRSGVSRILLYIVYALLLSLPAVAGLYFNKRSDPA